MTKTEQQQAAWELLQSEKGILGLLKEVGAKPDEVQGVLQRLEKMDAKYQEEKKETFIVSIIQQAALMNISKQELIEYLQRPDKVVSFNHFSYKVVAMVDGKSIGRGGRMPQWAVEKGWLKREDIPEEYWTAEYRNYIESQKAA